MTEDRDRYWRAAEPKAGYEVVIVGNSTMRDLFFRLPVGSIGPTRGRCLEALQEQLEKLAPRANDGA